MFSFLFVSCDTSYPLMASTIPVLTTHGNQLRSHGVFTVLPLPFDCLFSTVPLAIPDKMIGTALRRDGSLMQALARFGRPVSQSHTLGI